MADNDIGLWTGTCTGCGQSQNIDDATLREVYPGHVDALNTAQVEAMCLCGEFFDLTLLPSVQVIPFSAWQVLPAATGCPTCGREHTDDQPHDAASLLYQYWFRNNEAKQGRPERWPTWDDAMAHCPEDVQAGWREGLRERGVDPSSRQVTPITREAPPTPDTP